jgi:putative hemolysin
MTDILPVTIDVKSILEQKNPGLSRIVPWFIINYLKRIIHQDELNDFMSKYGHLRDVDLVKAGIDYMGISYRVHNRHNIPPPEGRYIFTSNHPLGGLDGAVFIRELSDYYREVRFPVNDILMNISNMSGVFLPVNKHGSQEREAVRMIEEAYASDAQILYFPAGLCSRKKKGVVEDLRWQKSVVVKARRHKRDIVPVYFSGENSNFFYNLANLRVSLGIKSNIEMLYLPDEMFRQKDKEIDLVFGKPVPWQEFDNSRTAPEWADWLKKKSYDLARDIQ